MMCSNGDSVHVRAGNQMTAYWKSGVSQLATVLPRVCEEGGGDESLRLKGVCQKLILSA